MATDWQREEAEKSWEEKREELSSGVMRGRLPELRLRPAGPGESPEKLLERKKAFFRWFLESNGRTISACRLAKVSPEELLRWQFEDAEFAALKLHYEEMCNEEVAGKLRSAAFESEKVDEVLRALQVLEPKYDRAERVKKSALAAKERLRKEREGVEPKDLPRIPDESSTSATDEVTVNDPVADFGE